MIYYGIHRPDKKESWTAIEDTDVKQLSELAFCTVLKLSQSPDDFKAVKQDPADHVKYLGPMYFDLDGPKEERKEVIKAAQSIVDTLDTKLGVIPGQLKIYLSGKKGFHIVLDERMFGLTKPVLLLPLVWKEFAKLIDGFVHSEYIDWKVYSMGKGRMWRCCNVQRPDTGTYKGQVTPEELRDMTPELYDKLVASPRPELATKDASEAIGTLSAFLSTAIKETKVEWNKSRKSAHRNVSKDELKSLRKTPGCIKWLVENGDCASSSHNQAAMQLAAYIAARYDEDDEEIYERELVEPFIKNVQSSARPTEQQRRQLMDYLLDKAFSGGIDFSAGGVIAAIGPENKCGHCVVCSVPIEDEVTEEDSGNAGEEDDQYIWYDDRTKIRFSKYSTVRVLEKKTSVLSHFGLLPLKVMKEVNDLDQEIHKEVIYEANSKDLANPKILLKLPEGLMTDRKNLARVLSESGLAWYGNESDTNALCLALMRRREQVENTLVSVPYAGIYYAEVEDEQGVTHLEPHLLLRDQSIDSLGMRSRYRYIGRKEDAPQLSDLDDIQRTDIPMLSESLKALVDINDHSITIPMLGWVAACCLKPQLTRKDRHFPMMSLSGSSGTGKTNTAFMFMALTGTRYRQASVWNAETDTIYPLEELVTTSNMFPRFLDECNKAKMKGDKWEKLIGILKASWDENGIRKGMIGRGGVPTTEVKMNPAPIMYASEQAMPEQSIRTRSLECYFTSRAIQDPKCLDAYRVVRDNIKYIERLGKVLVMTSMTKSIGSVSKSAADFEDKVPETYGSRGQRAHSVVLVGLQYLGTTLETYDEELSQYVMSLKEEYLEYLGTDAKTNLRFKRQSAIQEVMMAFSQMAADHDNEGYGIKANHQYYRAGTMLYLELNSIFPRYRRYMRSLGEHPSITSVFQAEKILTGESYYRGEYPNPKDHGKPLAMIDLDILNAANVDISNFKDKGI